MGCCARVPLGLRGSACQCVSVSGSARVCACAFFLLLAVTPSPRVTVAPPGALQAESCRPRRSPRSARASSGRRPR
eukprot:11195290-Alexandrium_andersonii.AAC.1